MDDRIFEQAEQRYSERLARAASAVAPQGLSDQIMAAVCSRHECYRWQDYFVLSVFRPLVAAASVAAILLAAFLLYSQGTTMDAAQYWTHNILGGSTSLML